MKVTFKYNDFIHGYNWNITFDNRVIRSSYTHISHVGHLFEIDLL